MQHMWCTCIPMGYMVHIYFDGICGTYIYQWAMWGTYTSMGDVLDIHLIGLVQGTVVMM